MNFEVLIFEHLHKMPSEYKPPPKKCLRTSIRLIFEILRYIEDKSYFAISYKDHFKICYKKLVNGELILSLYLSLSNSAT